MTREIGTFFTSYFELFCSVYQVKGQHERVNDEQAFAKRTQLTNIRFQCEAIVDLADFND